MQEIPDYLRSPTCWSLFFASMFATAVLTPVVMRLARRVGAVDAGGHRKIYEGSMPLLGGLSIALPFITVCAMGLISFTGMFGFIESLRPQFAVLALGSIAIVGLGVYDDTRGLAVRYKLLVQVLIAVFVVANGEALKTVHLPVLGKVEIGYEIGLVVGVAWIVGLINALNIIDGVDGLASGIALIAAFGLTVLGAMEQQTFVVLLGVALAGSLVGFLPFNFFPARIFLGDTGSMLLGFVLATITWMGTYKQETAAVVVGPLLALGFPIFETLVSMARRLIRGVPIFGADDRHTHHRLLSRGYSQRGVVLLLYGVAAVLTSVAIMSRVLPQDSAWKWLSPAVVIATLIGTGWLAGYLRTVPVERAVRRRQRNAVNHAFARYAVLSLSAARSAQTVEEILKLGCMEFGLSSLAVGTESAPAQIMADLGIPASGPKEQVRIRSMQGSRLRVDYEFEKPTDVETQRDVADCLAQLFERADLVWGGPIPDMSRQPVATGQPGERTP